MAKTPQQYYEELIANPKKQLDQKHTLRQQADAQQKAQINAAVDQSVQNATAQYEQRIAALPDESRELYDANALDEAVSRARVQEYLANMGMTDSGLTSSMATALSVQKGKADRQVRMNEQQQRQSLMEAIDQIVAEGEAKKTESAMSIDAATRQWYDETKARLEESARSSAAEAYAADQEYAAKVAEAQIKAQQEAAIKQQEYDDQRRQYVLSLMDEGVSEVQAWGQAYNRYPLSEPSDKNSNEYREYAYINNYYDLIRNGYLPQAAQAYASAGGGTAGLQAADDIERERAENLIAPMITDVEGVFTTWLSDYDGDDGVYVAQAVEEALAGNKTYQIMSAAGKKYAKAALIAHDVLKSWPSDEDPYNEKRMEIACRRIGADYDAAWAYYHRYKHTYRL